MEAHPLSHGNLTRELVIYKAKALLKRKTTTNVVIAKGVSKEEYLGFLLNHDNHDIKTEVRMEFVEKEKNSQKTGEVLIIELTNTRLHKFLNPYLESRLRLQHQLCYHLYGLPHIRRSQAHVTKTADYSLFRLDQHMDKDWPVLVLEIAYKYEDFETLQSQLLEWLSDLTTVEVAIGIMVEDFRKPRNGAPRSSKVRMRALLYTRRNNRLQNTPPEKTYNGLTPWFHSEAYLEFGTRVPRIDKDRRPLNIKFPLSDLFAGVAEVPTECREAMGNGAMITFDLQEMHHRILTLID
jgi:hypothetical protein